MTPELAPNEIIPFCSLPEVPERFFGSDVSLERQGLIQLTEKKWVNGTRLRYYFFGAGHAWAGGNDQKDLVRQGFKIWEDVGLGVTFAETSNIHEAHARIGFLRGNGSWSYLGRDSIDIPGRLERTMNFGWDLRNDPRGTDTPVHEIGHFLGWPHEHQNPFSGIVWDEQAVYAYFAAPPNSWNRETTFYNVLRKLPPGSVSGSEWDPDSVMGYGFAAGLINSPERFRNGLHPRLGITETDIAQARLFYPKAKPVDPVDPEVPTLPPLKPGISQFLSIGPAEQKDFEIRVENTGKYTIQTFGHSDTLLVLEEEVNGELEHLAGDDDSGTAYNASIKTLLREGTRYVLKVRLYLEYASDNTAVMLW